MPLYTVSHACDLSDAQKTALAEQITSVHAEKFSCPRLFVNVHFRPAPADAYIGGRLLRTNQIGGSLRQGPSRTKADFDDIAAQIEQAWAQTVGNTGPQHLGAVFITGGLLAAREHSLPIPVAGDEVAWVREHWAVFQQHAAAGDQVFADLLEEVRTRDCFRGAVPAGH